MQISIRKNKYSVLEVLFFLTGLSSTVQIFSLFGVTLFNILLAVSFLFLLVSTKLYFERTDKIVWLMVLSVFVTLAFSIILSYLNSAYKRNSLTASLTMLLILGVFICTRGKDENKLLKAFFKGFYYSCLLQIVWCILQFLFWYGVRVDINHVIFNRLFHMVEMASSYRDGNVVCTGLCWHAANLVPVLLFCYLKTDHAAMKILCLLIAFLSKSATLLIALILCLLLDILTNIGTISKKKYTKNEILMFFAFIFVVAAVLVWKGEYFVNAMSGLWQRIQDITSTQGGNSSATHFSYYLRLPEVILSSSLIVNLFGCGVACSGYTFTLLFGQYADMVWVVESDFVNILLSQGIIGFLIFYVFLFKLISKSREVSTKTIIFISIIILCGVMYNVQFVWTIFLELMMYACLQNKINVFETAKQKREKAYGNRKTSPQGNDYYRIDQSAADGQSR